MYTEWDEDDQFWNTYSNIITLARWMADEGYEASEVAYAVEKPWKFEDEFKLAKAGKHHAD